jgi:hypothetical protein
MRNEDFFAVYEQDTSLSDQYGKRRMRLFWA